MTDYLFSTPWWLPTLLLLGGAVAFFMGNNRRNIPQRTAGVAAALLAVALAFVSYYVDTPVETAVKQSKAFVAAFRDKDWTTFENLLDRKASLSASGIPLALYSNRDQLLAAAQTAQKRFEFTTLRVLSADAHRIDTVIPVDVTVYSEQAATMGRPMTSQWEFEWQDFGQGYKLLRVTALKIAEQSPDRLRREFPAP